MLSLQAPARAEVIEKGGDVVINLSKDAAQLLTLMYKSYLSKRASGKPKREANCFPDSHYLHEYLLPDWIFEDVDDTCRELSRAGLIHVTWADNIANHIIISDYGIEIMEHSKVDSIKDLAACISKVIDVISLLG